MREYNALIKEALNLGIKSPETYYYEGKIKGKASRDRGEAEYNIPQEGKTGQGKATDKENASQRKKKTGLYNLLTKPDCYNLPHLVEKISMIEFPEFLGGFKLFNRK